MFLSIPSGVQQSPQISVTSSIELITYTDVSESAFLIKSIRMASYQTPING